MRHIGHPCRSRYQSPRTYALGMPDPSEAARLPRPAAVIFDLDGTLIDTVGTRIDAWLEAFDRFGLPARRDPVAPLIGADGRRLAREIAAAAGRPVGRGRGGAIRQARGGV